jgi:hypothetical protein
MPSAAIGMATVVLSRVTTLCVRTRTRHHARLGRWSCRHNDGDGHAGVVDAHQRRRTLYTVHVRRSRRNHRRMPHLTVVWQRACARGAQQRRTTRVARVNAVAAIALRAIDHAMRIVLCFTYDVDLAALTHHARWIAEFAIAARRHATRVQIVVRHHLLSHAYQLLHHTRAAHAHRRCRCGRLCGHFAFGAVEHKTGRALTLLRTLSTASRARAHTLTLGMPPALMHTIGASHVGSHCAHVTSRHRARTRMHSRTLGAHARRLLPDTDKKPGLHTHIADVTSSD